MVLKMKYDRFALFHHPLTLPDFKALRKQLDDACASKNKDVNAIIVLANQLIPDLVAEEGGEK